MADLAGKGGGVEDDELGSGAIACDDRAGLLAESYDRAFARVVGRRGERVGRDGDVAEAEADLTVGRAHVDHGTFVGVAETEEATAHGPAARDLQGERLFVWVGELRPLLRGCGRF